MLKENHFEAWRRFSSFYREDDLIDLAERICAAVSTGDEQLLASLLVLPTAFLAINQAGSEGTLFVLLANFFSNAIR
jgi:hypothetical protein